MGVTTPLREHEDDSNWLVPAIAESTVFEGGAASDPAPFSGGGGDFGGAGASESFDSPSTDTSSSDSGSSSFDSSSSSFDSGSSSSGE